MEAERERWGKVIWDRFRPEGAERIQWDSPESERHDPESMRRSWSFLAERVRDELIGDGNVVVDRARFERLRGFTKAALEWEKAGTDPFHPEKQKATEPRLFAARAALLPSDIDPLP